MKDDKFEYFINQTNQRLNNIDRKLDQLISFRLMLIGGSMAISAIISVAIAVMYGR